MITLYRIVTFLLHPLLPLYLKERARRGKEDLSRMGERFGRVTLPRPPGRLFWFHASSMGESLSVLPLIKELSARYPDTRFLLTTVTVTSARMAAQRLPEAAIHQFAPVDTPQALRRFLAQWKPDAAFWVESELWPNMVLMTKKTGCPLFLINARISERSMKRWFRFRMLAQAMLESFTLILAKSEEDARRFRNLGAEHVEVKGNLKFSAPPLEADSKVTGEILSRIGDRPVWLAASTHPGEEAIVASIHQRLKESFPTLLSIVVPRHSRRGDEIASGLRESGLVAAQRSKQEDILPETDIYVADTMGELGVFYRIAGIVFIGGSLVPHGGQNPFEPARLDCAILYGPHMENFTEFCVELEAVQGAVRVASATELGARIGDLLRDHDREEALAKAAMKAVAQNQQVTQKVLESLAPYLDVGR